jgi:hypothetical protein
MTAKTYYRQCTLKQSNKTTVAWIADKFCTEGRGISIKDEKGEWSERWEVIKFSSDKTDTPPDYRKLIKGHRKATGDSLNEKFSGL